MTWSEKHIKTLQQKGKIKGYKSPRKTSAPKPQSKAIRWLDFHLKMWAYTNIKDLVKEHAFALPRKWRFDYAFRKEKIAIEFEGGIFLKNSGHNTAKHYTKDTEKYNAATKLGWRVLRYTALNYKTVISDIEEIFGKQ